MSLHEISRPYKGLERKKFIDRSAVLLWCADILCFGGLYYKFIYHRPTQNKILAIMKKTSPQIADITSQYGVELHALLKPPLTLMLGLLLIYHSFVYFYFKKGSYLAHRYVNFYVFTSLIGLALYVVYNAHYKSLDVLLIFASVLLFAYYSFAPKALRLAEKPIIRTEAK